MTKPKLPLGSLYKKDRLQSHRALLLTGKRNDKILLYVHHTKLNQNIADTTTYHTVPYRAGALCEPNMFFFMP